MKVKSIQVISTHNATDKVILCLEASTPFPTLAAVHPKSAAYPACTIVQTERGYGIAWATVNFPSVPIEVVQM